MNPIWEYRQETPGTWEDYVSHIAVFGNRIEYTVGWKEPSSHVVSAREIVKVKRGILSQKNIVTITTEEWPPHELVSSWDRATQEAFVYAVKQIMTRS